MTVAPVGTVPEWTVGDRLRKARETTGLDRAEFAAQLGVSRNTVTNYEHNRVAQRIVVLRSWAIRCEVPLVWLVNGTEPAPGDGSEVGPVGFEPTTYGLVVPTFGVAA